jgi:mono/diheme cytochrome c family protein
MTLSIAEARWAALGLCAAALAVLALTGCGTVGLSEEGEGDVVLGRELFIEGCGQCHVLADAGTQGVIGPNLDDAFAQARVDGLGDSTIQSVVRTQIAYPIEEPSTGQPGMPQDIFTGDDAESVAAYVASVAGLPTTGPPTSDEQGGGETGGETGAAGGTQETGGDVDGAAVFAEAGCGSCHTFEAAGSTGTIGPNLDEAAPSTDLAIERVTEGMGAMPAFGDQLSPEQIRAVAEYVSQTAG